ncbi:hypothetical protein QJS66_22200 [Kocuria rhizophila]|nr:hypothetical protein QJS66_22200 [Kocuria rhizophila]
MASVSKGARSPRARRARTVGAATEVTAARGGRAAARPRPSP